VVMVRANVTPALVTLSRSADEVRQTYAISALANLCEMVEGGTQRLMIEQGVLKVLSEKAEIKDANLRREVSRCYALLATKGDSQAALVAAGALDILAKRLKDTDHAVRCDYELFDPPVNAIPHSLSCHSLTHAHICTAVFITKLNCTCFSLFLLHRSAAMLVLRSAISQLNPPLTSSFSKPVCPQLSCP